MKGFSKHSLVVSLNIFFLSAISSHAHSMGNELIRRAADLKLAFVISDKKTLVAGAGLAVATTLILYSTYKFGSFCWSSWRNRLGNLENKSQKIVQKVGGSQDIKMLKIALIELFALEAKALENIGGSMQNEARYRVVKEHRRTVEAQLAAAIVSFGEQQTRRYQDLGQNFRSARPSGAGGAAAAS